MAKAPSEAIPRYVLDTNADGSQTVRVAEKEEDASKGAVDAERSYCNRCGERIGVGRAFHRVTTVMKDRRLYHHPNCTKAL